jgi:hypothetical protein
LVVGACGGWLVVGTGWTGATALDGTGAAGSGEDGLGDGGRLGLCDVAVVTTTAGAGLPFDDPLIAAIPTPPQQSTTNAETMPMISQIFPNFLRGIVAVGPRFIGETWPGVTGDAPGA